MKSSTERFGVDDGRAGFICIHCGNKVPELYKNYSSTVLKIIDCVSQSIQWLMVEALRKHNFPFSGRMP